MKNKKAFFLPEETVKIIISIIVILFLAGFLFSLYSNQVANKELEIAKSTLIEMVKKINAGEKEFEIFRLKTSFKVKSWILLSFPFSDDAEKIQPIQCLGFKSGNCLCICGIRLWNFPLSTKSLADSCDKFGTCQESNFQIKNQGGISYSLKGIFYKREDIINIENPPIKLKINPELKQITL